jgi:excisionase family DNA binding protein
MTIPQAAKYLNRCARTVRTYIKTGVLRAHRVRGRGQALWIRGEDVRSLRELRKKELSASDLMDLLRAIKVRLHSIDSKVDFLMRVNGLDISILRDHL